jgi:uncharacterized protein (DUF433 family)
VIAGLGDQSPGLLTELRELLGGSEQRVYVVQAGHGGTSVPLRTEGLSEPWVKLGPAPPEMKDVNLARASKVRRVARSGTALRGRLLNTGIYDVSEVARLTRLDPDTVAYWVTARPGKPALLKPVNPPFLNFHDLISVYVIHELRRRVVTLDAIRLGARYLSTALKTDRPFAHKDLATVGSSFFADLAGADEWLDAGRGGQAAFDLIIKPMLRPIRYGVDLMAAVWYPHDEVVIDPRIQAGAPCVKGTRIPTSTLVALRRAGESVDPVAHQFDLTPGQVAAAADYEEILAA